MIKNNNNERTYVAKEVSKFSSTSYLLLLKFIDILISSVVVAPCVVAYWRGTWELMELLMLPEDYGKSALISFGLGIFGHTFFTMCQDSFKKSFDPDKARLTYYIASRCYTAIFGFFCVNMWRGAWNLCDHYTSRTSLVIVVVTTVVAVAGMIVTRTTRNLIATPLVIANDQKSVYFEISTIFNTQEFRRPVLYFLDTLFSVIFVGTLVVIAWRGVWQTFDLTFYRDNEKVSAVGSLVIGYGIVIIAFIFQPVLRKICKSVSGTPKLILADLFYLIGFVGAVNVWRGIWILLDVYLYPENPLKSCYISHSVSFLILTVLNCSNSILVRGIAIDGEEADNSSCIDLPIAYVKLYLQNQRKRKYQKKARNESNDKLKEQESLMQS